MEIIIKFNIPEDGEDAKIFLAARNMYSAIWDFKQELRAKLKHGEYGDETYKILEELSELFHKNLDENEVSNFF